MDDGTLWVRSTAGNWVQVTQSVPMETDVLDNDFQAFIDSGKKVSENDVKVDNASQIIVDPIVIDSITPTPTTI